MNRNARWFQTFAALSFLLVALTACGGGGSSGKTVAAATDPAEPAFGTVVLSTLVDNPYLPMAPGTTWIYEGTTSEGDERVEVTVSHFTQVVAGVVCTVVLDRAYVDDELVEETWDWYAQDADGNIWYMGEYSVEYENGVAIGTDGSWEAGTDGAVAGILIKAIPLVGDSYQQEFYAGEAEDMAEVVGLNVAVTLADGSNYVCVKTREWTPLEPGAVEFKYYAMGVGLVREESEDGSEALELVEIIDQKAPDIDPGDFSPVVTNPFLPFTPGTTMNYEGETDEGTETIVIFVSPATRVVMGVTCIVVEDRAYIDGELVEETFDWFAQDADGNVWYFGEDSREIENGVVISTDGSWEAGVDGAQPGIIMPAVVRVGDNYRQEYYQGEAEDLAAIIGLDVNITLDDGTPHTCLQTLEWNPLEIDSEEHKFYAPGIGLVRESGIDGSEPIELVSITN